MSDGSSRAAAALPVLDPVAPSGAQTGSTPTPVDPPATADAPRGGLTLRYLTRFSCIGGACEDNCCSGWKIPLTRADVEGLRRGVRGWRDGEAGFETAVHEQAGAGVQGSVGYLDVGGGERGCCTFLDDEGLCGVQRRAGPGAIPTVCAQYPRDIALIEGRVETTARVSCPEVARLLLLHDDAIELVEQPAVLPPRLVATQVVEPDPADPWHRYYDDVRGTALALLGLEEVPLVTRQFLVAYFAKEVDAFYGPGRAVNEAGLANAVRRMRDPEFVAALIEQASALELPESLATAVAHHLLAHVVHVSGGAWEMVRQAYLTYATDGDDSPVWLEDADGEQQLKVRPAAFRARYRERAEAWEAAADERIDRYFTNYLVNAWMRGYLDAPSVTAFVRSLVLQTAILRFLLFSDPELPSPPADGPAQPDVLEALDRAAVRSVYRMSRATEHDPGYLERLDRTLDELGFTSFAHLVALLRS